MLRKFKTNILKNTKGYDIILNQRQLCDFECIANNSFKPINNFLNKKDYNSVVKNNRLDNGKLWPMPIYLDINKETLEGLEKSNTNNLCLRDKNSIFLV